MQRLNGLAREELPWKSSFEVYYGRIQYNIQNAGRYSPKQVFVDEGIIELSSDRNLQQRKKKLNAKGKGKKNSRQTNV